MSERPAPLTYPDLDLRGLQFMPLDVVRLRDSDIAALASGDAFRAAVLLWCAAWHQVPAASLPTDDANLARYAGYGRDVKSWLKVKDEAMRGFIECADGRLYHPVIAEKATESDNKRRAYRDRTAKALAARNAQRDRQRNVERNDEREQHGDDPRDGHQGKVRDSKVSKEDTPSLRSGGANRRGSRLPDDWQPTNEDRSAGAEILASDAAVVREINKFRDYWIGRAGAGGVKLDWSATWRNWCRRAVETAPNARAGPQKSGGFQTVLLEKIQERQHGERSHNENEFADQSPAD